tara:strand:- start:37567 stop:37974 length:408 start_codon:yes stop_codon:yes gene_type:complete
MPAETAHLYVPRRVTLASGVGTTDAHRMNAGQVSTVGPMISTTIPGGGQMRPAYLGGSTPIIEHAATMFLVEVASESANAVKYTLDGQTPIAGGLGLTLAKGANVWITKQEFIDALWIDDAAGGAVLRAQGFRAA